METVFMPGDRVQKISGGQIMTVQKHPYRYHFFIGWYVDYDSVVCSWIDEKGNYQKETFRNRVLRKASCVYDIPNNLNNQLTSKRGSM